MEEMCIRRDGSWRSEPGKRSCWLLGGHYRWLANAVETAQLMLTSPRGDLKSSVGHHLARMDDSRYLRVGGEVSNIDVCIPRFRLLTDSRSQSESR